jgi:hypothetical protein
MPTAQGSRPDAPRRQPRLPLEEGQTTYVKLAALATATNTLPNSLTTPTALNQNHWRFHDIHVLLPTKAPEERHRGASELT